jgi:hypothetical protein
MAERGEEHFQVLVNTIPEEPTPGYAGEMKVASEALSNLIDIRNEKPLITSEHFENPKGEMVLFRMGENLEKILKEHHGEKRLLFAGGSKKFYRDLSRLNQDVDFCMEETKRLEKVSNSIGELGEQYIRDFLGIRDNNETRIKGRQKKLNKIGFHLDNFQIQRKIHCSIKLEKITNLGKNTRSNDFVRYLTRELQNIFFFFGHHVHDLRINGTVFIPSEMNMEPNEFDGAALDRDVFRSLSKCVNSICVKKQDFEGQVDLKVYSKKLQNLETLVLSPTPNQRVVDKEFTLFEYQFDVRNTQRSILQVLTLLYFGKVRVNLPKEYKKNFQNWFDVCSTTKDCEVKQVLNNMKGREIKKSWEASRLATGVLCSELFEDLTGEEAVQALTLAHNFSQTSSENPLPLTLQKWPALVMKKPQSFDLNLMGGSLSLPQPKQLEYLLTSSLFDLMSTDEFIFTTDPEKFTNKKQREEENLPARSASLVHHVVTPDATCLRRGKKDEVSMFYIIDVTLGGGKGVRRKLKEKLRKYQPTDLGKSFITKTIIVILYSSSAPVTNLHNALGLYHGYEQLIILNKSKMTGSQKKKISSKILSGLLKQLMSKDIWGIEYMIHDGSIQLLSYD